MQLLQLVIPRELLHRRATRKAAAAERLRVMEAERNSLLDSYAAGLPIEVATDLMLPSGESCWCDIRVRLSERSSWRDGRLVITDRLVRVIGPNRTGEVPTTQLLGIEMRADEPGFEPGWSFLEVLSNKHAVYFAVPNDQVFDGQLVATVLRFAAAYARAAAVQKPARASRYIPEQLRAEVWARDGGRCVECGATERLRFDHVIPWSKGGDTAAVNLQLLCEPCNRGKSASI